MASSLEKNRDIVGRIPLFRHLDEESLAELTLRIKELCFPKGKVILFEDDTLNYMYVINSGKVKVVQTSPDGREHIIATHTRGDFFGEMGFLDFETAPASVIAMNDCRIGLLSRYDFIDFLSRNCSAKDGIINVLCSRLREAWFIIKILHLPDAEQRIRAILGRFERSDGVKDMRGVILKTKLTHQDIACYANLSRETVTRVLSKLRKNDEIDIVDRTIIIKKLQS